MSDRPTALEDLLRRMTIHATDYRGDLDAAKALLYLSESGYEIRLKPMLGEPGSPGYSPAGLRYPTLDELNPAVPLQGDPGLLREAQDPVEIDAWMIQHRPLLRDAYVAYVVARAEAERER